MNPAVRAPLAQVITLTLVLGVASVAPSAATLATSAATGRAAVPDASTSIASPTLKAQPDYGRLPMAFEPNVGQTDDQVRYLARGRGYSVFVTDAEVVLAVAASTGIPIPQQAPVASRRANDRPTAGSRDTLRMSLVGASNAQIKAERVLPGKSNYFLGADESRWHRDVPTYAAVRLADLYSGIDAVFYGTQERLEYDFVVAPGADPSQIRVRFDGQVTAEADDAGELSLRMRDGAIRQQRAAVFQQDATGWRHVAARAVLTGDGEIGFDVGEYDRTKPLIIDPALIFGVFGGGAGQNDFGAAVAIDDAGSAYVAGNTRSASFPTTAGAFDTTYNGGDFGGDTFVSKFSPSGDSLVYSTYLGGTSGDVPSALAVDASGAAYVTGQVQGGSFPTTPGAYDTTYNGGAIDAFVAKLTPSGSALAYATFLGSDREEHATAIAVDSVGHAYVTGYTPSPTFPTTPGAHQTTLNGFFDAFVTKLTPSGGALAYSTYLGDETDDEAFAVAVDSTGSAYVTGCSTVTFVPNDSALAEPAGVASDDIAFVARLAPAGDTLHSMMYFGGNDIDEGLAITIDSAGGVYIAGRTNSTDFPTTPDAFDTTFNGGSDTFIAKLSSSGDTFEYSTLLGGSSSDTPAGIAVDAEGCIVVAGCTYSADLPTTEGAFDTSYNGGYFGSDGFVAKLTADVSGLVYATYFGGTGDDEAEGVAVNDAGLAYIAGWSNSPDLPTTAGAFDPTYNGAAHAFLAKLSVEGDSLEYSTFLASTAEDASHDIAVDLSGSAYVTGFTESARFPVLAGGFDTTYNDVFARSDAFVMKLDAAGSALVYSTYLGGPGVDVGHAIAIDSAGAAVVVGATASFSFPTTSGAFDTTHNGVDDVFVTKLGAAGNALEYSTFIGGGDVDVALDVSLDTGGAVYVAGFTRSPTYPRTVGAFGSLYAGLDEGFVTKLSSTGGSLTYSGFIGGSSDDRSRSIAVDASGAAFVTGTTSSVEFPTTNGAFDQSYGGGGDAYVVKIAPAGNARVFASFLGAAGADAGLAIAVDPSGSAFVTGRTESPTFPTTTGAFDRTYGGGTDAFLTRVTPTGNALVFSSFLGAEGEDVGNDIAFDEFGAACLTGVTASTQFPITTGVQDATYNGNSDTFVTRFGGAGDTITYSACLGGTRYDAGLAIALDASGAAYVAGQTRSDEFPGSGFGFHDGATGYVVKLTPSIAGAETPGVYLDDTGSWFLRNVNASGEADIVFGYGPPALGWAALRGDWNGDGVDSVGLYDAGSGFFLLRNENGPGPADTVFGFGPGGGGLIPLSGDWDGDGTDGVGVFDPATSFFFLRNELEPGVADLAFGFGPAGLGWTPVTGDFDGNGTDTVGLYAPESSFFFLRNSHGAGAADLVFGFGPAGSGWVPVVGDFDGDGRDTVGLYRRDDGFYFLKNSNQAGPADRLFGYGPPGAVPLVGDWNGQ